MRFDDTLATVLARRPERAGARIALWRQLLDLLAQQRDGGDRQVARMAFDRVVALRADVPVEERRATAAAIAGRPVAPAMVALLAGDVPVVAGAVLSRVRLSELEWLALLPRLSPTARGFLRHRDDLGPHVAAALSGFGHSDLAIAADARVRDDGEVAPIDPAPAEPVAPAAAQPFEPGAGEGQIRAIISRIADFRLGREDTAAVPAEPVRAEQFLFETGADGVIHWVDGVPRGAAVGESIATPAGGGTGVDAQAPGAFRRRAPFRDARLTLAGEGAAAGEWRIAAVPVFAPATGRFLGYRGTARRPLAVERADTAAADPVHGADGADTLRQLVHELRTPLNAIGGFAEMIRRQMRGPIAEPYRERAARIAEQAGQLLVAVDDLDVSARLDAARLTLARAALDIAALIAPACEDIAAACATRGVELRAALPAGLPPVHGDGATLRRMATRLLSAVAGVAAPGTAVRLELAEEGDGGLTLSVTRPATLAAVSEQLLFDPGYGSDGEWPDAPLLGLGFSLHLVRRLAAATGAQLLIEPDWFVLHLPVADEQAGFGAG